MAHDALGFRIMLFRINSIYPFPLRATVRKVAVAADAELPALVGGQGRWILWVTEGWPVAVFAPDSPMEGAGKLPVLFLVALAAVPLRPVLDGKSAPLAFITLAVPAVHIPAIMDAEVGGDVEHPDAEDQCDK